MDCNLERVVCGQVVPAVVVLVACGVVVLLVACGLVWHWLHVLWCVRLEMCLSLLTDDTIFSFDLTALLFLA